MALRGLLGKGNRGNGNLQAHMALNSFMDQRNAENQQAAMQEAAYYERLNAEAEKMLGPDRKRLDDLVSKMQGNIRDKIALYGGDRKEFLRNGGYAVLQKFSGNIQNSPEFQGYIKNKENYTRIMDMMSKGFGHLLTNRDKHSLENYQANGGGEITYSGIMSEIDFPDSNEYDLGQDIPLEDILYNEENYMKILGNYTLNNPDLPPPKPDELYAFMRQMGYGDKGSNRDKINLMQRMALQAAKDTKTSKDNRPQLFTTRLSRMLTNVPENATLNEFFDVDSKTYAPSNKIRTWAKDDDSIEATIDGNWKHSSKAMNENEDGPDIATDNSGVLRTFNRFFGNNWAPAEANEIGSTIKDTIAEWSLNATKGDNGYYHFDPSTQSGMFSSKGVELVGSNNLQAGAYRGNYENLGVTTGLYIVREDGNKQMVMNITNNDGDIDTKAQRDHIEEMRNANVDMGYFVAMKNVDNERIYYKQVDMDNIQKLRHLSTMLGSSDDLSNSIESDQRLAETQALGEQKVNAEQGAFDQRLVSIDTEAEQSPDFMAETRFYAMPGDPTTNRSSLIKSFYAATGLDMGGQNFSAYMNTLPEAQKLFRTYGHKHTDEQLIDIFVNAANNEAEQDPDQIQGNIDFGRRWKNAYKRYLEINSN